MWGQTHPSQGRALLNCDLSPQGCAGNCVKICKKWRSGLGIMLENVQGDHANDQLLLSCIPETHQDSPIHGMRFYFQCSASCPGILLALLRTQGVQGEQNTGIEMYPTDQRRESARVRWGCVFSLVRVSVAPITSSEKCMYSSEGENIPLCLFLFNIVYTENGETHL